jgi:hypothetical protein
MKLAKLTLIAATFATLASGAAFADNSTLRTLIDLDRQRAERNKKATTVAVYTGRQGAGQRCTMPAERAKTHYELRWNAHGERFGLFVRDKE